MFAASKGVDGEPVAWNQLETCCGLIDVIALELAAVRGAQRAGDDRGGEAIGELIDKQPPPGPARGRSSASEALAILNVPRGQPHREDRCEVVVGERRA